MRTYEYPLGTTFRASTHEHAAARAFGGKPGDYIVTLHSRPATRPRESAITWIEVAVSAGDHHFEFVDDIPIID